CDREWDWKDVDERGYTEEDKVDVVAETLLEWLDYLREGVVPASLYGEVMKIGGSGQGAEKVSHSFIFNLPYTLKTHYSDKHADPRRSTQIRLFERSWQRLRLLDWFRLRSGQYPLTVRPRNYHPFTTGLSRNKADRFYWKV